MDTETGRHKLPTTEELRNPLDTAFGPLSKRAQSLEREVHGEILEISSSALKHLLLSTVSDLARIAERRPNALKYFPKGSTLILSAEGDRGDYLESGYLIVYCELKFPGDNGSMQRSGKEAVYHSSRASGDSIQTAFERFLNSLERPELQG